MSAAAMFVYRRQSHKAKKWTVKEKSERSQSFNVCGKVEFFPVLRWFSGKWELSGNMDNLV